MAELHYLKHAYGESDETVIDCWLENSYWQYFCGYKFFQHRFPLHPTALVKWRKRIGEAGMERLLAETIACAGRMGALTHHDVAKVNVDTTVQKKAIAFPLHTDEDLGLNLDNTIYALDSTTIDLCLSVFPWAHFRSIKAAVKPHTLLDLRGNISTFIHVSDGKLHDVNVLDILLSRSPTYTAIVGRWSCSSNGSNSTCASTLSSEHRKTP